MLRLKQYRRSQSPLVYLRYMYFVFVAMPLVRKFRNVKRKTLEESGKIFAVVGADGSGKSTLVREINKWLSWKLCVRTYYYGIPKSIFSKGRLLVRRGFKRLGFSLFPDYLEAEFWIYVARARRRINKNSRRNADDCEVVLTDRFPLREFHNMNLPMDGPRLVKNPRFANSLLARTELKIYDELKYPDRILVLQVNFDELRSRKNDLDPETHFSKADAINNLESSDKIVLINANRSYKDVELDIKQKIWEVL